MCNALIDMGVADKALADTFMYLCVYNLQFEKQGFDGRFLSLMTMDDYSATVFPQATKLHFKVRRT